MLIKDDLKFENESLVDQDFKQSIGLEIFNHKLLYFNMFAILGLLNNFGYVVVSNYIII